MAPESETASQDHLLHYVQPLSSFLLRNGYIKMRITFAQQVENDGTDVT